jgi:hypothetical protein
MNVVICGGRHHIGAAALGVPRPSLASPEKTSASVSVITITGHRDDELARRGAHFLAAVCNATAVVTVGIHLDAARAEDITRLESNFDQLIREIAGKITEPGGTLM